MQRMGSDELERDDDTAGESMVTDEGTGRMVRERGRSAEKKRKRKGNIWNEGGKDPLVDAIRHTKILSSSDANYVSSEQLSTTRMDREREE